MKICVVKRNNMVPNAKVLPDILFFRSLRPSDALKIEADFFQITPLIRALRRHGWKDPIELNVGGVVYAASSETLTKYPDSFLGCLWRGVVEAEFDSEGRIFIDRDGQLFRHVVNFLRTDRLALPDDFKVTELIIKLLCFV